MTVAVAGLEGVDPMLVPAGAAARGAARLTDLVVRAVVAVSVCALDAPLDHRANATTVLQWPAGWLGTGLAAALVLYDPLWEAATRGRTPGKLLAGVRVVTATGGRPGPAAALLRLVVLPLDLLPATGLVALVAMWSRPGRRLGDLAAGTLVVRDGGQPKLAIGEPWGNWLDTPGNRAELARWRVDGLTAGDERAVRTFLNERATLRPDARAERAAALWRAVAPRIGGRGDLPWPPEACLEAVLAAIARRDR